MNPYFKWSQYLKHAKSSIWWRRVDMYLLSARCIPWYYAVNLSVFSSSFTQICRRRHCWITWDKHKIIWKFHWSNDYHCAKDYCVQTADMKISVMSWSVLCPVRSIRDTWRHGASNLCTVFGALLCKGCLRAGIGILRVRRWIREAINIVSSIW